MTTLENIYPETCKFKVEALKSINLSRQQEICYRCEKEYELTCQKYKPLSRTREPIRRGLNAYILSII